MMQTVTEPTFNILMFVGRRRSSFTRHMEQGGRVPTAAGARGLRGTT